jgi:thiol-disulfide isomerase/thioredoxin
MTSRVASLALVLPLLSLGGSGCKRAPPLPPDAIEFGISAAPGDDAPAFDLAAMDGKRVSLASFKGRVVFVNFWATWCPPCADEMPSMMALARELEERHRGKFTMLAVSVDEGWDPVRAFFQKEPYGGSVAPLTVLLDGDSQTTTTLYYCAARGGCPGEFKLPESYIVDRQGKLVAYVVGPRNWSDPRARSYLEQLLR